MVHFPSSYMRGAAERFCLVWKVTFSEKRQYMDSFHLFGLSIYRQFWTATSEESMPSPF